MASIKSFEDLDIWKNTISLSTDVYSICQMDPLNKDWSLRDQLKRASLSVANNIAEGFEYNNNNYFIKHLRIAKGSCGEVKSMIVFLQLIQYTSSATKCNYYERTAQLSKSIGSLISYLQQEKINRKR